MNRSSLGVVAFLAFHLLPGFAYAADPIPERGPLALHSIPQSHLRFGGILAPRLENNIDQWLLPAPEANPAMLEMFRLRDREPAPRLEPWAGEFAGKYLISCVQAMRLTDRPELKTHTARFVAGLLATQADDGYLGPFPKSQRLLGAWDLWGHYHIMQGLLLWHDATGDAAALAATRRAADLICHTYLDGTRRVFDAGSQEMNMAVAHVMAELHRRTGEPRYLALTQQIVNDWKRAGDYLRTGLAKTPFYRTPRPRWESLHDLQALVELWRITGETPYRDAFISHWQTIRDNDRRNTGAFSGGEQATGNPFAPTAIETCCTVAWMALSIDMLRLTADPHIADELELSTFNAALGAQHPSGRWWTYSTPMDGVRKASAHEIVFQSRPGSPELNCCSANGPRSLGMLSDWAVMSDDRGIVINWLGPFKCPSIQASGRSLSIQCETTYPLDGHITYRLKSDGPVRVRWRIPAWATAAAASIGAQAIPVATGSYLEVERHWDENTPLELHLPLDLRTLPGQNEQFGKVSIYRGPLLLAYDQQDNPFDEKAIPRIDLARLGEAKTLPVAKPTNAPWLLVELPGNPSFRLRDFATAGSSGTHYHSWLRTTSATPSLGPDATILSARLNGTATPEFGQLLTTDTFEKPEDVQAVRLNGRDQKILYALPEDLGPDFTVALHVRIREWPAPGHIAQVFSAWTAPGDDPLRLTIDAGKLYARIESDRSVSIGRAPLDLNRWYRIAAVKQASHLTLYLDGKPIATGETSPNVTTASRIAALGGNPLYTGQSECLAADFSHLLVKNRALSASEISSLP